MKHYLLGYVSRLDGEDLPRQYWRCQADNIVHAINQLLNHHESTGESVCFVEVHKPEGGAW